MKRQIVLLLLVSMAMLVALLIFSSMQSQSWRSSKHRDPYLHSEEDNSRMILHRQRWREKLK